MPGNAKSTFTDSKAQQIWLDYLRRVESLCGALDDRQTADILTELKAHLLESYIQLDQGDERSRISTAIARLGEPEEFVPHWVEERLLDGAQLGSSTRNLFYLLRSNALKGIQQFAFSMLIGFGYLLSFYFFIMSILKLLYPENVGLYLSPSGFPVLAYVDAEDFTELMGYWLTPVGLVSSIFLQYLLNQLVRRWVVHFRR